MFVFSLLFAAAAASGTMTDTFLQRVADQGFPQQKKIVTAAALPPGWTSPVPLPQTITVLGSIAASRYETVIYYYPDDAARALQTYIAQLRAAGFRKHLGTPGQSGFSFAPQFMPNVTVMCRGREGVSITTPSTQDLRVTIPDPAASGACSAQPARMNTPLPGLVSPADATIVSGTGGGSISYAAGAGSNVFSSATIETAVSPGRLMAGFAWQLQAAHWKAERAFATPQGAAQSFVYDDGKLHWKASILLFPGVKPHTYDARLDASGTPDFSERPGVVAPQRPAPRLQRSDEPAALQLAQRIAGAYEDAAAKTALYVRQLPRGFNSNVPLPAGTLVGSVVNGDSATLYYDVMRAQFDAYVGRLERAGWRAMPMGPPRAGGFELPFASSTSAFCKGGMPLIYTSVRQNSNDVTVRVTSEGSSRTCVPSQQPGMQGTRIAPVPALRAPANATLRPGGAGIIGGASGATITSALPVRELLANFAGQFAAAGWTAREALVSDALGSQVFLYGDPDGTNWQSVLTIYRSQNDAKTYYAFLDVTQL